MKATITSTAHYVPEKVLTNSELEKFVETSDEWIQSRVGIKQRHVVNEGEASSDMSTEVAKSLLQKNDFDPRSHYCWCRVYSSPQPHPGTQSHRYRCSLPGLAEFTIIHCERTEVSANYISIEIFCRFFCR